MAMQSRRTSVVPAIANFVRRSRLGSRKLMAEIVVRWPRATPTEITEAFEIAERAERHHG
jgi:hypothetical protein